MKTLGIIAFALLCIASVAFWMNSEAPIRYRFTVTVASSGLTYSTSSVIEINMNFQEYWSPQAIAHVTGDAMVIEVPGHAPVFVLLRAPKNADWAGSIPFALFRDRLPAAGSSRERTRALLAVRDTATLRADQYPIMVAFRDIADAGSVYELAPNDLSPPLSPDARVVSMAIEMTRDGATYQVEKTLPWLPDFHDRYFDGDRYERPGKSLANSLTKTDFMKRGQ